MNKHLKPNTGLLILTILLLSITLLELKWSDIKARDLPGHEFGIFYDIREIEEPPLPTHILRNYTLYELYIENRSEIAYSIPGYSIDIGTEYSSVNEILALIKDKSSRKTTVLNLAAGAAGIAFGGIAKTAANTAMRIGTIQKKVVHIDDGKNILSANKNYIIYPNSSLSLYFFINKSTEQLPTHIKFICRDENNSINRVIINNNYQLRETNASEEVRGKIVDKNNLETEMNENLIAEPGTLQYR